MASAAASWAPLAHQPLLLLVLLLLEPPLAVGWMPLLSYHWVAAAE
jgi:hypothetical protein